MCIRDSISTSLAPYIVRRIGVGRLLAIGTFLSAAALGVSAASATMWQFLGSVALLGLAAGAVDATLNASPRDGSVRAGSTCCTRRTGWAPPSRR